MRQSEVGSYRCGIASMTPGRGNLLIGRWAAHAANLCGALRAWAAAGQGSSVGCSRPSPRHLVGGVMTNHATVAVAEGSRLPPQPCNAAVLAIGSSQALARRSRWQQSQRWWAQRLRSFGQDIDSRTNPQAQILEGCAVCLDTEAKALADLRQHARAARPLSAQRALFEEIFLRRRPRRPTRRITF